MNNNKKRGSLKLDAFALDLGPPIDLIKSLAEQRKDTLGIFHALLDHSPLVFWLKNAKTFRLELISSAYRRMFDLPDEISISSEDELSVEREILEGFHDNDIKVIEAGIPMEFMEEIPNNMRDPSKGSREVPVIKYPVFGETEIEMVGGYLLEPFYER